MFTPFSQKQSFAELFSPAMALSMFHRLWTVGPLLAKTLFNFLAELQCFIGVEKGHIVKCSRFVPSTCKELNISKIGDRKWEPRKARSISSNFPPQSQLVLCCA